MAPHKSRIQQISILLSGIVVVLGTLVLIGWFAHIVTLQTVVPGFITMKANTAICFICGALALGALLGVYPRRFQTPVVVVCVAVMVVLAGGTGLEYLSGHRFGIDELFFRDYVQFPFPGRMAPITALNFVLIAFGLAGMGISGRCVQQSQAAAILVGFSALFAISGYIFGVPVLYGSMRYTAMALHTGVGFLLISWAMLCARPRDGLMRVIFSAGPGGVLARTYMPVAIFGPLLLGRVLLSPVLNFGDLRFGMAMLVLTCNILFVAITWVLASRIEKTQLALNESEAQFRELANAIPQLCWMANADGWIFWYNQRWYDYTGTTADQMAGWGWQSVHDPEALPSVMARWQGSIATGEPFDMVFPLRGADGVFRPFLTRVMPLKDADGKIARWFGTNTDISEQKQAEIELRKSKERLDLAVEVAGLGEWELDLKNCTSTHSLRHDQIFGYSSPLPDWSYAKFLDYVLPELRESVNRQINSGNSWSIETKIRRADGEVRWIWVRGRRRVNDAGQVERMFGVVTDITERKQAEEERARLAAIVESSGDAIISKDLSGIVSSWNRSAEQLFGYSAQEMIGQPITRVIPPERLHEETDFLARLRAGECIDHYETVRVDKQGRRIDVSVTLSPICDSAGAVVGISKSVRDVTERKNAEEELRRQAEMLRLSFDAIIVWRLDGGIESWNRGAELLYGYSEAEALGRVTHELLKTTRSVPWPAVEAELRERGNWEGELRHIARDGREVMVSARHQLIVGSDGIVRILETNRDITERKRTQEALQASEHRWATTLRSIGDAVISTDPDGKIDFMNDVAQKLTGWTLDDAMGRDLPDVFDIVQEVTRIRPESPVAKVIRLGKVVGLANHTALIHRNGTEIPIEDSAAPIRDNQGKMEGVVLVFHDCREQRRVEAALRSSERLATTGRLAATIAHEIHNPLDAVGNLLFLIREEARDDNMREYASMASSELARVTQMTQQMLGFQREAARPVPVKIGEILSNVVALYDRKIQTAGIRLEQRIDHDVRVVALPGELRQIFANLVGNAIEAVGPQRGTIALRAYFTHDRRRGLPGVCVVVADNGPGIPEQVRSKIFEPFFTTKGESGTGLGLWITADILRKYDGAVRLRTCTHPARSGTCFSVFLPFQIHSESTPRS